MQNPFTSDRIPWGYNLHIPQVAVLPVYWPDSANLGRQVPQSTGAGQPTMPAAAAQPGWVPRYRRSHSDFPERNQWNGGSLSKVVGASKGRKI